MAGRSKPWVFGRSLAWIFFFNLIFQSEIRAQNILQANGLAGSLSCRHTTMMRSPPARRSRSPYYRSAGHRFFHSSYDVVSCEELGVVGSSGILILYSA